VLYQTGLNSCCRWQVQQRRRRRRGRQRHRQYAHTGG